MNLEDLKNAKKTVGAKQTSKAIKREALEYVFVACDCDEILAKPMIDLCTQYSIPYSGEYSMKELGKAASIKVDAAAVGVLR